MRSRRKRLGKRENGRDKGGRGRCVDVTGQARRSTLCDAGCQRDRSFTRFQPRPRISSALFPSFHAVPNRAAGPKEISAAGLPLLASSRTVFSLATWRENSKSDAAADRTTSGSGVAEDHVANRVNDSRSKFNVKVRNRAISRVLFLLSFFPSSFPFFFFFFSLENTNPGNLEEGWRLG